MGRGHGLAGSPKENEGLLERIWEASWVPVWKKDKGRLVCSCHPPGESSRVVTVLCNPSQSVSLADTFLILLGDVLSPPLSS